MKKVAIRLLVLVIAAGVAAGGYYLVSKIPGESSEIATASVRRGDLVVKTYLRGELTTVRSMTLTSPNLGSASQITRLAPPGALAQAGDLIAEFDDSDRRVFLEDVTLDVEQIQQNLKKAETDLEIRKGQDEVELIRAQFALRRAELEVKRNELLSSIDARKNVLTLEESRRRLEKLEQDIKSRLQQREAELAVLRAQLREAQLEVSREQRRIEEARVLAPMSGLVSVLENRSGRGGFGQTTPQIREGDQIPAGMALAQILDLSEMDLLTKVEEVERASLREGQESLIRLDALPGKIVHGKIKRLGNTAATNVFRGEATKKFECVLSVDMAELLKNVGASPEQVSRILATARENAQRGVGAGRGSQGGRAGGSAAAPPAAAAEGGRRRGAGRSGAANAGPDAAGGPAGGGAPGPGGPATPAAGEGGGQRRGGRQMTPEQRQKMEELLAGRDMASLSQEERQKMFQQMRASFGGPAGGRGPRPAGAAGPGGQAAGENAAPPTVPGAPGAPPVLSFARSSGGQFTAQQRAAAQLPRPPETGSDVEILLRPGLLADAEIIIEDLPNVIHIPYQAVIDLGGQPVVYVQTQPGRFEPRRIRLGQRSESRIVVLEGLEEGQVIALESPDPSAAQDRAKKKKKSGGDSSSKPAFPGGGAPGGQAGRQR
jgi:HlyD family secretion protein